MRKTRSVEESKEEGKTDNKKLKKRLVIVLLSVLSVIVILFGVSIAIDKYYDKKDEESNIPIDYDFYPEDYDEYIYNDVEYAEKIENGFIEYTDSSTGLTLGIERDTAEEYGEEIAFMVDYLYSIIEGKVSEYNGFFSDAYYEANDKHAEFTMQKLYEVKIIKESVEPIKEDGIDYTKFVFVLEYKIFKNNGTFRNDIGDGSKKQYITVTDRSGELRIDEISTAKYR